MTRPDPLFRQMFEGFTSRCTSPLACAAASPRAIFAILARFAWDNAAFTFQPSFESLTSESCIAMYGRPSASPTLVDGADVLVVNRCHRSGFAKESLACHLLGWQVGPQDLQGNPPIEPLVFRLIDDAHAAGAKLSENEVLAQTRTWLKFRGLGKRASQDLRWCMRRAMRGGAARRQIDGVVMVFRRSGWMDWVGVHQRIVSDRLSIGSVRNKIHL